jgi:hypothetical protein
VPRNTTAEISQHRSPWKKTCGAISIAAVCVQKAGLSSLCREISNAAAGRHDAAVSRLEATAGRLEATGRSVEAATGRNEQRLIPVVSRVGPDRPQEAPRDEPEVDSYRADDEEGAW